MPPTDTTCSNALGAASALDAKTATNFSMQLVIAVTNTMQLARLLAIKIMALVTTLDNNDGSVFLTVDDSDSR